MQQRTYYNRPCLGCGQPLQLWLELQDALLCSACDRREKQRFIIATCVAVAILFLSLALW